MTDDTQAYRDAGVDLDAAEEVVQEYKGLVSATRTPGVMGDVGGFGGLFSLVDAGFGGMKDPVLVSGTDGVGTKLKLAFQLDKHDTIGIDCVAMCVNDIATAGAKPLFFLDYLATGKLEPHQAAAVVAGIAKACKATGCALIGGETAEMPGFYPPGEYDVAGFSVGIVERSQILNPANVKGDEVLIGVASTGFHSNGFSLVRKIVSDHNLDLNESYGLGRPLGEALLEPTALYVDASLKLVELGATAVCHITGGGFPENLPRVLPEGVGARLRPSTWPTPPVIDFICDKGQVPTADRYRVFNMGLGLVAAIDAGSADSTIAALAELGHDAWVVGELGGSKIEIDFDA